MPNPIPEGRSTVSTYLVVDDAAAAIEFYQQAFGAEEVVRFPMPDGKSIMHAELRLGDSHIMISDEFPGGVGKMKAPKNAGVVTGGIHLYVEDVDDAEIARRAKDSFANFRS